MPPEQTVLRDAAATLDHVGDRQGVAAVEDKRAVVVERRGGAEAAGRSAGADLQCRAAIDVGVAGVGVGA